MSRYIDADYVLVEAENIFSDMGDYGWLKRIFENPSAPSIDIVRCGECKQWQSDGGALMFCEVTDIPTDADDFCSYGERREP